VEEPKDLVGKSLKRELDFRRAELEVAWEKWKIALEGWKHYCKFEGKLEQKNG